MHFNGQNRKKWRKRTPIIFWFYINVCLPTFSGGPQGWENDVISGFSQQKKLWHISKFSYGSYKIFGMVGILGTIKKSNLCFRHSVSYYLQRIPAVINKIEACVPSIPDNEITFPLAMSIYNIAARQKVNRNRASAWGEDILTQNSVCCS